MRLRARLAEAQGREELLAAIHQATEVAFRRHHPRSERPRYRRRPAASLE
jgi:hypothetical protein